MCDYHIETDELGAYLLSNLKGDRCFSCGIYSMASAQQRKGGYTNIMGKEVQLKLCNACGIRYSKTKSYCVKCHYIPYAKYGCKLRCPDCHDGDKCCNECKIY